MFTELINNISQLEKISEVTEGWSFINFNGKWENQNDFKTFEKINELSENPNFQFGLSWQIDRQVLSFISFLEELENGSEWKIIINKTSRLKENKKNFFNKVEVFKEWANTLDPFDVDNPLLSDFPIKIFVNKIKETVVGNNYIICPISKNPEFKNSNVFPDFDQINSNIHILHRENFIIEPKKLFINEGECTDNTINFFIMSVKSIAICLTSEIINNESIILRGIRKIELPLFKNCSVLNTDILSDLKKTLNWVYEDKSDLKIKLYLDRFTLDVDLQKDFVSELIRLNKTSLEQSKERFSFITFERKDQFQKELRDLLKDLKTVSDLYSTKARGLLSNLLRDVLAGLLLIGLTILSKIEDVKLVTESPVINLVFKAFSFYFIISILYQSIFDFVDIIKTKNEFIYWKKTSREYISESEFKEYMKQTVGNREKFTYIYYSFLIITYFFLAYISYNFLELIQNFIEK